MYRFDITDDEITKLYLCKDHIDEKNDPKYPRVAVFLTWGGIQREILVEKDGGW